MRQVFSKGSKGPSKGHLGKAKKTGDGLVNGVKPEYLEEALRWFNSIPEAPTVPEKWAAPDLTKETKADGDGDAEKAKKKAEDVLDPAQATARMDELKRLGRDLLDQMVASTKGKKVGSSEEKWLRAVSQSGTMSDRSSAALMLVKSSPLQSLSSLDALLTLAKKKGEKVNMVSLDALKELFLMDLLPNTRKLRYFREQPWRAAGPAAKASAGGAAQTLGPKSLVTRQHLIYWYFEEELKLRFSKFVSVLGDCSKSNVEKVREIAVKIMYDLLNQKPEQEKQLLTMLVNKLGDPERKVASKAVYLLHELLTAHPNMKFIVAREVELFAFRPNVSDRAKYYSMIFLNQIIILQREPEVSIKLVDIYFKVFTLILEESGKGDIDARILSAILTGLNRAIPFVPPEKLEMFDDNINDLYRLVHITSFNKSVQVLYLLFQVCKAKNDMSDRYFRSVYAQLLNPELSSSKRVTMFLNVLYQTMKVDKRKDRLCAFIKRILQVCLHEKASFVCGALFMISEIVKSKPALLAGVTETEEAVEAGADEEDAAKGASGYDPVKRDPLHSEASKACFWELTLLEKHFHPSVVAFAKALRKCQNIDYGGDPMLDFATVAFLDKFVYKNAKQRERLAGGSIMQSTKKRKVQAPVNSSQFLQQAEAKVAGDDLFFYKYFKQRAADEAPKEKSRREEEEEEEEDFAFSEEDDEEEDVDAGDAALMGGPGDSDSDEEPEFGYDEMDFDEDEEDEDAAEGDPSERQLEKMLLENMSDLEDEDEEEEEDEGPGSSAFASAEEFEHLFQQDAKNPKQEKWEKSRAHLTSSHNVGKKRKASGRTPKSAKRRKKN